MQTESNHSLLIVEHQLFEAGDARTAFMLGDARCEFEHSYLEDPLSGLAKVALSLAWGIGLSKTDVLFDVETDHVYTATFAHRDPTEFQLRYGLRGASEADQETLMQGMIASVPFAVSVAGMLHQVLVEHGQIGCLHRWNTYCFPIREYLLLRLLMDRCPEAESVWNEMPGGSWSRELELMRATPQWGKVRRPNAADKLPIPYNVT